VFSDVQEARKALATYIIRNRVKITVTKNYKIRLEAVCDTGCTFGYSIHQKIVGMVYLQ
jgi:hypothetical protein